MTTNFSRAMMIVLAVLFVVGAAGGYGVFIRPAFAQLRAERLLLSDAVAKLERARAEKLALSVNGDSIKSGNTAEIEKLTNIFVKSPEGAYLINVLQDHARNARLFLTSFDLGIGRITERDSAGPLASIPIQVQLKGAGYREFKEFLKRITTSVPLLNVTAFTFDPKSATVSVNLLAYRLRDPVSSSIPLDASIFADPKFNALAIPIPFPATGTVGRENPFALPGDLSAPQ